MDMNFLDQYYSVLEKIDATKGKGVMITISAGDKIFSTGFDLPYWCKAYLNMERTSLGLM